MDLTDGACKDGMDIQEGKADPDVVLAAGAAADSGLDEAGGPPAIPLSIQKRRKRLLCKALSLIHI